jgi:hypothetical protein
LNDLPGLRVREIPDGSNLSMLYVEAGDLPRMREALRTRGIELSAPSQNFRGFVLVSNETLARKSVGEIVRAFEESLRA